ncbi:MAG: biotin--[acetyl-CoA-carboxylase] ligase [Spirochaetota bacterium]
MKRLVSLENKLARFLSELKVPKLFYYDSVSSTMDEAFSLPRDTVENRTLVLSDVQTSGRGRYGRTWYTDIDDLCFSVILTRFDLDVPYSMVASRAVYDSFRKYTDGVRLKWINDVCWENGKKIAGVLTEEKEGRMVIGMGVNLNTPKFPEELEHIATSYFIEASRRIEKDVFLRNILQRFFYLLGCVEQGSLERILREWERDSGVVNKKVRAETEKGVLYGVITGINKKNGALQIKSGGKHLELYDGTVYYRV